MANPNVNVIVGADAIGFHRTWLGVESRIKKTVGLAEGLKGALAGALGGFAITSIVQHMADFAKNLEDTARNLQLTVGQVWELKKASNQTGIEFAKWEPIFRKIEDFQQRVVNRDPKAVLAASQMGLTPQSIAHLHPNEVLRQGLSSNASRASLEEAVGSKNVSQLVANRRAVLEHLNAPGTDINAEAVHSMARFKLELDFLAEEIERNVLPAFARMVEWVEKVIGAPSKFAKWTVASDQATAETGAGILDHLFMTKKDKAFNKRRNEIFYNLTKPDRDEVEDRRQRMAALDKIPDVNLTPQGRTLSGDLGTNKFLKIGGLMGADTNYRLERLGYEQVSLLQQIRDLIAGNSSPTLNNESINSGNGL